MMETQTFPAGLEKIYQLTNTPTQYELRVDLGLGSERAYAVYDNFKIATARQKFKLTIGKYSGTAGGNETEHESLYISLHFSGLLLLYVSPCISLSLSLSLSLSVSILFHCFSFSMSLSLSLIIHPPSFSGSLCLPSPLHY